MFPNLPTELQLAIWKHAIPQPQVVKLKVSAPGTAYDWPTHDDASRRSRAIEEAAMDLVFTPDLTPCGLLAVCSASRTTMLDVCGDSIPLGRGKRLHIDGLADTLLLYAKSKHMPLLPGGGAYHHVHLDYRCMFAGVNKLILAVGIQGYHAETGWWVRQFEDIQYLTFIQRTEMLKEVLDTIKYTRDLSGLRDHDERAMVSPTRFLMRSGGTMELDEVFWLVFRLFDNWTSRRTHGTHN